MKKNIFYPLKSIHERCLTLSYNPNSSFLKLFWANAFTKKRSFYGTLLLFLVFSQAPVYSQLVGGSAVQANFGVEADAYANLLQFGPVLNSTTNTDDWFVKIPAPTDMTDPFYGSGKGVIDQSAPFPPINNTSFTRGQSVTTPAPGFQYPIVDGRLWIDAVYGRDTHSAQSNKDSSIFTSTSDKNSDNPSTWNLGSGSVPQKDDIVDVMAHLRGVTPKPPTELDPRPFTTLWAFTGATLRSTSGSKHIDFEFYRTLVSYTPGDLHFGNTGDDGGRTAWTFDATGNIVVAGGIIISVDYENGGIKPDVRIRVWMDETVFNGLNTKADRPFDVIPGSFEKGELSETFGYGRIAQKQGGIGTNIYGRVNDTAPTLGPPWGTLSGPGATPSADFQEFQFVEVGINLTAFGLDQRGSSNPCANILGSILVKTRSCAGGNNDPFTCEQKDFAGPFPFGVTVEPMVTASVNRTITCTNADATILATNIAPSGATIEWYGPSVNGDKGPLILGSSLQDPDRVVTVAGVYTVRAVAPGFFGCFAEDTVEVMEDKTPPPCTISGTDDNFCPSSTGHIYSGPDSQTAYAWSIISGNATIVGSTTSQSVSVTAGSPCGDFVLQLITTGANGCTSTCTKTLHIVDTTPPVITFCPPGSDLGCNPTGIPAAGTPTATDNCGTPTISSELGEPVNTGGCNWSRTRTYTATDTCGNTVTCTQVFTYTLDTTDPIFTSCPADANLGCNPTSFPAGTPTATDNCGGEPTITGGELGAAVNTGGCIWTRSRTWTATDDCGNSSTCTQVFTYTIDTTDPTFTFCPADANLGCNPTSFPAGTPTATDNCGGEPTITGGELGTAVNTGGCIWTRSRTWTATDGCGNSATCTQVFTYKVDVTPPTITCSANKQIECNAAFNFDPPTASDNCDGTITPIIVSTVTNTDGSKTRTWKATDECGNENTCSQTITVANCVHIFPTNTTCTDFSTGTAVGLPKVCTPIDDNGVVTQGVNPGVFFYYSFVTVPTGSFTIDVKQTNDGKLDKLFIIQGYSDNTSQIRLTTSSCGIVPFTASFIDNGSGARLTGTNTSGADAIYIVSIKYDVKSIVGGDYTGTNTSSMYTFASYLGLNVIPGSTGTINAEVCSSAKIAPIETKATDKTIGSVSFDAYPVPFKDQLTIKYKFDYKSDVKIEVFNAQGMSVLSKMDTNSYLNKEVTLDLKVTKRQEQVYLVKLTTDRETITKKVMSSK